MGSKLLQTALTIVLNWLLNLITSKWDDYKADESKKQEIKLKVKAIKDAETQDEIRNAVRDLSI
jgi:hypothetical protein